MNLDYYSVRHNSDFSSNVGDIGTVLLLGGNGGVGQIIKSFFDDKDVKYFAPSHKELDWFINKFTYEYNISIINSSIINKCA